MSSPNTWVLRASKVSELERLREKEARRIVLKLKASDRVPLERLQAVLTQYRGGGCQVGVQFHGSGGRGTYSFGAEWNVRPARPDRGAGRPVGPWPRYGALQPATCLCRSRLHRQLMGTFLICKQKGTRALRPKHVPFFAHESECPILAPLWQ